MRVSPPLPELRIPPSSFSSLLFTKVSSHLRVFFFRRGLGELCLAAEVWIEAAEVWTGAAEVWTGAAEVWTGAAEVWTGAAEVLTGAAEVWTGAAEVWCC